MRMFVISPDVNSTLKTWRYLAVSLFLLCCGTILHAQTLAGINGVVTDPSGAVVPDAKVTITNNATGVSRAVTTSSSGTYYVTDLIPGAYTVRIEKSGFKTSVQNDVNVQTATMSTANTTLTTGQTSETIEVTAPQIALQTEEPQVSTTIQDELVQELPTQISGLGRQIDSFLFLVPGTTGDSFSHRINGGVDFQNEVVFNGIPVAASETQGYQTIINPPFDLIKEFTVLQGAFSAQYGLAQGVAQYQTESGTNHLHGKGFFVYRDAFFDAPGAVNGVNPNDRGKIDAPNTDHETDWGFSLGGPVIIPKLYDGRNKTFWYMAFDKFRLAQGQTPVTVPAPAFVNGDFSGLVNPTTGAPIPIFVPIAWQGDPSLIPAGCNPGAAPGAQFPGNIIPGSCISSVSKSLLGLVPTPSTSAEIGNYVPKFIPLLPHTSWGITGDHNLTSKQALHGVFWRENHSVNGGFIENPLNNSRLLTYLGTGIVGTYSNSITPNLVMTGGVSWIGEINNQFSQFDLKNFAGAEPTPGSAKQYLPGINFNGGPWEPTSWSNGGWAFSLNRKLGVSIENNWLYLHGRHTMNFGVDIRRSYQDDFECQSCAGEFAFDSATTADPVNDPNGTSTGAGFASFLLGNADGADRQFAAETKLRNLYIAPYFQDNMKVTPRLGINWGLRWDLAFPFSNINKSNRLVFFNPNVPNPGAIDPATGQPRPGAMAILGTGCDGCIGFDKLDMQWHHFSPRLGVTYQLNDKTVLLVGLSFSYLDTGAFEYGTNKVAVNYGNNLNGSVNYSPQANQAPGFGQWDTTQLPAPAALPFTPDYFNTNFPHEIHKHVDQGYTELLTAGVQRELPWKMFASVSYVHTHDLHLPASLIRRNELNANLLSLCSAPGNTYFPGDPNLNDCVLGQSWTDSGPQGVLQSLGFGLDSSGACNNPGTTNCYSPYNNFINDYGSGTFLARALLPYAQFRGITNNFDTTGADKYDALQASLQKRTSSGLTFLIAYTLSRTTSNTDSGFSTFNFKGLNNLNPNAEWSVGNDDRTHVLNISGVYELPIGPGKKLLNRGGLAARNLLGGWQISGIFRYFSGTPVQILSGANSINSTPLFYAGQNRANILPGPFDVNWNGYYTGQPIINPNKFADPGAWTLGNAAPLYPALRYPFSSDETLALAKKFFFGERVTAELRMEYYNILNRMQVCGNLNNTVGIDGFGQFSGGGMLAGPGSVCQGNTPRQGQAFFKVTF